jgi:hypothetical protein
MLHTCSGKLDYDRSCDACREAYEKENRDRGAPSFRQKLIWKCERCGCLGEVGNETHACAPSSGPCLLCGDVGYALSFGGSRVCPLCDAGSFHDEDLASKRLMGLKPPPTVNERRGKLEGSWPGSYQDSGGSEGIEGGDVGPVR